MQKFKTARDGKDSSRHFLRKTAMKTLKKVIFTFIVFLLATTSLPRAMAVIKSNLSDWLNFLVKVMMPTSTGLNTLIRGV